jgi:hypothetical protein
MASFGNKYKNLIISGSNRKSEFNTDPNGVQGVNNNRNPYTSLISSNSTQKSLFNNNPGIEFGIYKTKNPYVDLIGKWDFTKVSPEAPFIGRDIVAPIVDIYYVLDDYVEADYVEIQQGPAW